MTQQAAEAVYTERDDADEVRSEHPADTPRPERIPDHPFLPGYYLG